MPVYQRKGSPYWWYSFSVGGGRFRGSTKCKSKREAKLAEAKLISDAEKQVVPAEDWTLTHCLAMYWADKAKDHKSAKSILAISRALRLHLGGDTFIKDLTNERLIAYRADRRGEPERAKKRGEYMPPIEAHTVNRDFATLKAALNRAHQIYKQPLPPLAWKEIRMKERPHRIRFLSYDEFDRLIAVCDDELTLLVKVAVATGLRKANLLNLDWSEVDLSTSLITVLVKGDKFHSVRIPAEMRAALSRKNNREGLVFDTVNFRRRWTKAVKEAGLKNFRFHDLRHTCASWMRMNGCDLIEICEALGHSSVAVTQRYAHITPNERETAFDRISADVWSQNRSQSEEERRKA